MGEMSGSKSTRKLSFGWSHEQLLTARIKESRLMAEFREQDSYINSDYDDSDVESGCSVSQTQTGITNSITVQAEAVVRAVNAHVRPLGLPVPKVRYVLSRLEESPEGGYADERIPATFAAIRDLGVELILGYQPPVSLPTAVRKPIAPTKRIMLDLSVIVALCCDSTHQPLPRNKDELEERFRPFRLDETGQRVLEDHTNVSKDLRDQLGWEMEHPVLEEIQARLGEAGYKDGDVEWYVTREVKDRTPGIVDLIGGPVEQRRARALYGESEESFWAESRYEGREGILRNLRVKVLESDLEAELLGLELGSRRTMFDRGIVAVCERMISVVEGNPPSSESTRSPSPALVSQPAGKYRGGNGRKARNRKRPHVSFPPPLRLPSTHTLRTLMLGVKGGMTVLTNNRGAIGKIVREMGVHEGLPFERDDEAPTEVQSAAVWVVNPSSLAEWRRVDVERANAELSACDPVT